MAQRVLRKNDKYRWRWLKGMTGKWI